MVRDQDGKELEFTRRTIALCRCGKSRMRPLCDGTHRLIKFRAPGSRETMQSPLPSRPSAPPRVAAPTSAEDVLRKAALAHRCLEESLRGPCLASDYRPMRLAEPLVGAACSLLGWSLADGDLLCESAGAPDELGIAPSRRLVDAALSRAMRLSRMTSETRADQIRSLLGDAALALRPESRQVKWQGRTSAREQ